MPSYENTTGSKSERNQPGQIQMSRFSIFKANIPAVTQNNLSATTNGLPSQFVVTNKEEMGNRIAAAAKLVNPNTIGKVAGSGFNHYPAEASNALAHDIVHHTRPTAAHKAA